MTYRKYTQAMDEQETYIDGLLQHYGEVQHSDRDLSAAALDLLADAMTPTRYLGHGLQMISAYVQQLAHSSYLANCAAFQTADQLRRVQRVAYRTRQLADAYPDRGFGTAERQSLGRRCRLAAHARGDRTAAWSPSTGTRPSSA